MKITTIIASIYRFYMALVTNNLWTTRRGMSKEELAYLGWSADHYKTLPIFQDRRPANKWEMLDMVAYELYEGALKDKKRPIIVMPDFPVTAGDINWLLTLHPLKPANCKKRKVEFCFRKLYIKLGHQKFIEENFMISAIWKQNVGTHALAVGVSSNKLTKLLRSVFTVDENTREQWYSWFADPLGRLYCIQVDGANKKICIAPFDQAENETYNNLPPTPDEFDETLLRFILSYLKDNGFNEEELKCLLD